jgi:hypothetical protein
MHVHDGGTTFKSHFVVFMHADPFSFNTHFCHPKF